MNVKYRIVKKQGRYFSQYIQSVGCDVWIYLDKSGKGCGSIEEAKYGIEALKKILKETEEKEAGKQGIEIIWQEN